MFRNLKHLITVVDDLFSDLTGFGRVEGAAGRVL